ncbi:MAG: exodeoxyribonuclease VII large subunit [Deltaproteobacteria bacterium]|nr:MAG: exodeoxyribonuclease VII large subunit [Deltaproteobacteria bacterium]
MSDPVTRALTGRHIFTISELVAGLRGLLEDRVGRVWAVGEVSNLRRAPSGHYYFTLKDEAAQLRGVLFRGVARQLPFELEAGLEFVVYGEVTVYESRGDLQLLVRQIEPRGRGAHELAFEQLRRRLEAEGLFDPARKRPLPELPSCVGVVTSPSGAALHDVIRVRALRSPVTRLVVAPTRVQGDGAEHEVAQALAALSDFSQVDVILLVRGGGSLEDLSPFNTEVVARAIIATRVPVVSGVGHEVDLTIADLVADHRAPTPSAAAAAAFPDGAALLDRLRRSESWLRDAARRVVERATVRLSLRREALRAHAPSTRLAAQRARLEAAQRALRSAARRAAERARARLGLLAGSLESLSPLAVLGRGYAIVQRERDGTILRSSTDVELGEGVRVRLMRGEIQASVTGRREPNEP